MIVDGCGNPWFKGDVGIKDGKIMKVGKIKEDAARTIDASKMMVSPGFIDIHDHSDTVLFVNPKAESSIRQGVTTIVPGNCGNSAAPLTDESSKIFEKRLTHDWDIEVDWRTFDEYLSNLEKQGIALNVASLVGHATVRAAVMGDDYMAGAPKERQLDEMKNLVAKSMKDGAFGMSTALAWAPGSITKIGEIIELAKVVAEYEGFYACGDLRGQAATSFIPAVKEVIQIAEESSVPLLISHHEDTYDAWGQNVESLRLVDEARRRGIDVTVDAQHSYMRGIDSLSVLLPDWAHEGGEKAALERLKDPKLRGRMKKDLKEEKNEACRILARDGLFDRIWLTDSLKNPELAGKSVAEIAKLRGKEDPFDVIFDLLLEEGNTSTAFVQLLCYREEDMRLVLKHPTAMFEADGFALAPYGPLGKGKGSPRSYGAFAALFRKYVRGESNPGLKDEGVRLLTYEEAVRKVTSLPAQRLGMADRGLIKEGFWADVTVFDPENIRDTATYENPYQYAKGVEYVVVNGVVVIDKAEHTGALPGKTLRGKGYGRGSKSNR
jgi:N-acyl-D-amino-acid deacylase